tara:strand:+ start:3337 stop:3543 length:207 start_codon:yes stop_codon:yes gene_type:complete
MGVLKKLIVETLGSKKALAAITAVIGIWVAPGETESKINQTLGIIGAWLVAQGIADNGKAAAKIQAGE